MLLKKDVFLDKTDNLFYLQSQSDQIVTSKVKSNTVLILQLISKRSAAIEKVKKYLAVTIKEHEESFDPDNIRDFIDLYIKASRDQTDPEIFTGTVRTIFS